MKNLTVIYDWSSQDLLRCQGCLEDISNDNDFVLAIDKYSGIIPLHPGDAEELGGAFTNPQPYDGSQLNFKRELKHLMEGRMTKGRTIDSYVPEDHTKLQKRMDYGTAAQIIYNRLKGPTMNLKEQIDSLGRRVLVAAKKIYAQRYAIPENFECSIPVPDMENLTLRLIQGSPEVSVTLPKNSSSNQFQGLVIRPRYRLIFFKTKEIDISYESHNGIDENFNVRDRIIQNYGEYLEKIKNESPGKALEDIAFLSAVCKIPKILKPLVDARLEKLKEQEEKKKKLEEEQRLKQKVNRDKALKTLRGILDDTLEDK